VAYCSRFLGDAQAADELGNRLRDAQREGYSRKAVEQRIIQQIRSMLSRAHGVA